MTVRAVIRPVIDSVVKSITNKDQGNIVIPPSSPSDTLLLETGEDILLEDGNSIQLE